MNGAAQATKGIIISITADDAKDRHSVSGDDASAVLSVSCYHIVPWPIWVWLDGGLMQFFVSLRGSTRQVRWY